LVECLPAAMREMIGWFPTCVEESLI